MLTDHRGQGTLQFNSQGFLQFQDFTTSPSRETTFSDEDELDHYLLDRTDIDTWVIKDKRSDYLQMIYKHYFDNAIETHFSEITLNQSLSKENNGVWAVQDKSNRTIYYTFDQSTWFQAKFQNYKDRNFVATLKRQKEASKKITTKCFAGLLASLSLAPLFYSMNEAWHSVSYSQNEETFDADASCLVSPGIFINPIPEYFLSAIAVSYGMSSVLSGHQKITLSASLLVGISTLMPRVNARNNSPTLQSVPLIERDIVGVDSFMNALDGSSRYYFNSVVQDTDNGYVVTGYAQGVGAGKYDIFLAKFNEKGPLNWGKVLGGADDDVGNSVILSSDGGYVVAGYTESFGVITGGADALLMKFNNVGVLQWAKTLGGTYWDTASAVVQANDGGYTLTGFTESFGASMIDILLAKFNSAGVVQWTKAIGGSDWDVGNSIARTYDNGYVVTGWTGSFGEVGQVLFLMKFNSAGALLWGRALDGSADDVGNSVIQATDGYVVAGYTESFGAGQDSVLLLKFNGLGTLLWAKWFGGGYSDVANSVIQAADEGYVMAGYTSSAGAGSKDILLLRVDSGGALQWTKTLGGSGTDYSNSVIQTRDGGYAVAGYTWSFGQGTVNGLLAKINHIGSMNGCAADSILGETGRVNPNILSIAPSVQTWGPTVGWQTMAVSEIVPTQTIVCAPVFLTTGSTGTTATTATTGSTGTTATTATTATTGSTGTTATTATTGTTATTATTGTTATTTGKLSTTLMTTATTGRIATTAPIDTTKSGGSLTTGYLVLPTDLSSKESASTSESTTIINSNNTDSLLPNWAYWLIGFGSWFFSSLLICIFVKCLPPENNELRSSISQREAGIAERENKSNL